MSITDDNYLKELFIDDVKGSLEKYNSETSNTTCIGIIERSIIDVVIPKGAKKIGTRAFNQYTTLKTLSIPSSLTIINAYAFYDCTSLVLSEIPAQIKTIGEYSFRGCTSMVELVFKGTPETIATTAFTGCTNLTTINVPWAEGAVSGAPWGATNATINYNYTGE